MMMFGFFGYTDMPLKPEYPKGGEMFFHVPLEIPNFQTDPVLAPFGPW
jgi:hypothetical protein